MITLYRKYRPQDFDSIVGQNHIKITLQHEILSNKTTHAYLFCGPRGVGKTTIARIIAKSLNCEQRKEDSFEPCNKCKSCTNITAGNDLDMIEIDAASHTGVDNVRENIIAVSRISPSRSKFKVFIIDEVHMLSISAFNALLKILEEPPKNVVFVLCTTEVHKIPATIISRCERFDFKRMNVGDIVKRLAYVSSEEGIKIEKGILESIARHSEGHMRDALSLLGQVIAIGEKEITQEDADIVIPRSDLQEALKLIDALSKKDASRGIETVNRLLDDGIDLKKFVGDFVELLRKMMLLKINPSLSIKLGLELGPDIEEKIAELAKSLDLERIVLFIEKFIQAKNDLSKNFIKQLPLEIAIVSLSLGSESVVNRVSIPSVKQNPRIQNIPESSGGEFKKDVPESTSQVTENVIVSNQRATELNVEILIQKWNEVLAKIKKHNHSLSFILRVCEPRNIEGNKVCLAFKYKFHKDRMTDLTIKKIVEKVLHEVYGTPLLIDVIVDENIEAKENTATRNAIVNNQHPDQITNQSDSPDGVDEGSTVNDKKIEDDKVVDSLLKTFGGKVVE